MLLNEPKFVMVQINEGDDYSQHASGRGRTGGAARSDSGPAAAGASAAAAEGGAAVAGTGSAKTSMGQKMKASRWASVFGALAACAVIAACVLLVVGVTDVAVAGFIVAVIAIVVGLIPVFSG